jgi:hypothetical protein
MPVILVVECIANNLCHYHHHASPAGCALSIAKCKNVPVIMATSLVPAINHASMSMSSSSISSLKSSLQHSTLDVVV